MKFIDEAEARARLDEILEEAQRRQAIEALERQLFATVPKSREADTPSDSLSVTKRAV